MILNLSVCSACYDPLSLPQNTEILLVNKSQVSNSFRNYGAGK